MSDDFLKKIQTAHAQPKILPGTDEVNAFINNLLQFLFPELNGQRLHSKLEIETNFNLLILEFEKLLFQTEACNNSSVNSICECFFDGLDKVYDLCLEDAEAIYNGDPAAVDVRQVIRSYPGFFAISVHRIANLMCKLGVPYLPRIFSEYVHNLTGIDLHPKASIGRRFCIDHGTGIVIGETCHIGDDVKIYQGVTLGALSVDKSLASTKRHPTIENNVVIYSGTTILGGDTVIGHHSVIGGNVWLTQSVEPYSKVYYSAEGNQTHRTGGKVKKMSVKENSNRESK